MGRKTALSRVTRDVTVWLEAQPGVRSVVQGKLHATRHHHKPGFTRVRQTAEGDQNGSIHVVTYDEKGQRDLFVHAAPGPQRDRWVAALAQGTVVGDGAAPEMPPLVDLIKAKPSDARVLTAKEAVVDKEAGQLYAVTPALAAQWLERNTRNRKLRQSTVNQYAADMKAGRWMISPDGIAFDTNGNVVNGQHRLWAVLESGETVTMMVVFGLDPDVVAVLDDHLKRNLSDVAKIRRPGQSVSTVHAAVANLLLTTTIWATSANVQAARARISRQEQLDALDRHWDAIEFAYRECFHSQHIRGITQAAIITPVARAFYTQDRNRLRQFGTVMTTGMIDTADDKSGVVLRNMLLRQTANRQRAAAEVTYRKAERALQAFMQREHVDKLYEANGELFPLPEEKKGRKG